MEVRSVKAETGSAKQNFKVYTAEEFIAAITQHIPKKSFQIFFCTLSILKRVPS